ncbi:sulfotransferase family protein [Skermania piniformis]|uniref:Sulfotransferase n=1 Tax=Skermania pinensis TaxID=39122 RepID=A0ABX8SA36_9ACTN|nr:sulfotransferase [Skermania piniformis]QXQ14725.1 sulfotransferase [Skermania piniformis]
MNTSTPKPPRTTVGPIDALHASAARITGLTAFGDPDEYREGLGVLIDALNTEADLTATGRAVFHAFLRSMLLARLASEAGFAAYPASAEVPIVRPIFVTGLPRTGTTALHRLLVADPDNQGLQMWLTEFPQPRPPRAEWTANPVFARIDEGIRRHHIQNPEFMGVHFMSAGDVEECWQLLRQSATSISYETLAHVPSYSAWLAAQDWHGAYARHRRNLQLIGLPDREKRWVLKNPSHLFALDALLAVYPDALIVQTHRDPATAISSACSLAAQASAGWSETFSGDAIGRSQLELWSRGLRSFAAVRARHDPGRFVDVAYTDFVADPLHTVAEIYRQFGLNLTPAARAAMTRLHAESRTGDRRPAHRYALADFGLTEHEVDAAFAR